MRRVWIALLWMPLTGCGVVTDGAIPRPDLRGRPARVVATTGMVADTARVVGGRFVAVEALMGPGVDPHQYKASAGDLRKMEAAELVLYNGLHLEGKITDVFERLAKRVRTVAVTRDLPESLLRPGEAGFEGSHDPHVWFDVSLWSRTVETVRDALSDLDPAHADEYHTNAAAYREELAKLHADVSAKAATVPAKRRVLVTAHDAFFYFGRAYGFEVRGLQGISTASEPGTRDVEDLATLVVSRDLPAIFGETSVPERNLRAVQDAVERNRGRPVKIVADALYSDALGEAGSPAGTYAGMVRHNIGVIVTALTGE